MVLKGKDKNIHIVTLTFSVLWLVPMVNPTVGNGS